MKQIRIRTVHQADPIGIVPGGVDTFIRGIFKWAPDDLAFSLVGMSTDPVARPVGQWTQCDLGRRQFDFFPVFAEQDMMNRSRIPLSVRLMAGAWQQGRQVRHGFDILEAHRIEPLLLFKNDPRPKNAFFHQDMSVLTSVSADIRWKALPQLYFWVEKQVVPQLSSAYCVRETGAQLLRKRFPEIKGPVEFIPTWVDTDIFHTPKTDEERQRDQQNLMQLCGFERPMRAIVTVGRLDTQKDPLLLLDAFERVAKAQPDLALLYIGDGTLRADLTRAIEQKGLKDRVVLLGLRAPRQIAEILRGASAFALSSAYEGMPMALLEALACGLPVATTDVGEVRRVVDHKVGAISATRGVEDFAHALESVLHQRNPDTARQCEAAIKDFHPSKVLEKVYENYRRLGHAMVAKV